MFRCASSLVVVALLCASSGASAAESSRIESRVEGSWEPCDTCEWGVRSLQDYVANVSHQQALEETIDAVVCAHLPASVRPKCESGVHSTIRQAVRAFEDHVSPRTICRPVCPDAPPPRAAADSWQCPFCEFLAMQAERALENKTTDKEVLQFIEEQCAALPQAFQQQCQQYVQTDGPELIQLIETKPASEVCADAGACEPPNGLVAAFRAAPPSPAFDAAVVDLMQSLGRVRLAQTCAAPVPGGALAGAEPSQECEFCRVAVTEARAKIADPEFQSQVEKFLQKLCKQAGDYQEMCVDSIQEYAPLAFSLALDYVKPTLVCVDLVHMCPTKPPLTVHA